MGELSNSSSDRKSSPSLMRSPIRWAGGDPVLIRSRNASMGLLRMYVWVRGEFGDFRNAGSVNGYAVSETVRE